MDSDSDGFNQYAASHHYDDGCYWEHRRDDDSSFKVELLAGLLETAHLDLGPKWRAAEVGCGDGGFLLPLSAFLARRGVAAELHGYDISPQAIRLARGRVENLSLANIDFQIGSAAELPSGLDFIFCMDVIEHVENPAEFLRNLAGKSQYVVAHLPIEHSFGHLVLRKPSRSNEAFFHVQFYSWESAQILLKESPFQERAHQFSAARLELIRATPQLRRKAVGMVRYAAYRLFPRAAAVLAGGSVLLLLENR